MRQIKESDWKLLRQLKSTALERLCKRILTEAERVCSADSKTFHERYLQVYQLIYDRDKDIGRAFNDLRRSTALSRLASMRAQGLLTDEEFSRFSEETRGVVSLLTSSRTDASGIIRAD
ncbi:MAG: peptide ABC transporter substrate-binding protein [Elusimicrobia bacterium]|nr:peptide ABC transporter substrate-binding protein [Elusimicrobiota bacterium]